MAKVFISYSRKDIEFAKRLTGELQKGELDFWIDWEGIPPTVDWWKEIEKGIEEADVFIFLISPDSAKSKICGQEIDCAVKNGKRLIPLVVRDIEGDETLSQLSHLNWIFFRENDDFDAGLEKLLTGIHTDYAWVQEHRWLQVRALDWQRENRDNGSLLRGKDLQDAEFQLATNTSKEPHPTDLQREYVFASRKATDRQRRITTSISIAGVITLAALAVWGWGQAVLATASRNDAQAASTRAVSNEQKAQAASTLAVANEQEAKRQTQIALARQLAARAITLADNQIDLALLMCLEAKRLSDSLDPEYQKPEYKMEIRECLLRVMSAHPLLSKLIDRTDPFEEEWITDFVNSDEGSVETATNGSIYAIGEEKIIALLDVNTGQNISPPLTWNKYDVRRLRFSPDGEFLLSDDIWGARMALWDMPYSGDKIYLQVDPPNIWSTALSPDHQIIASGAYAENRIYLWDTRTGNQIGAELEGYINNATIVFSPDGKYLASPGCANMECDQREIRLWAIDVLNGSSLVDRLPQPDQCSTFSPAQLAFTPDGQALIYGCSGDPEIHLWSLAVADNRTLGQVRSSDNSLGEFSLSHDGRYLAVTSGTDVQVWELSPDGTLTAVSPVIDNNDDPFSIAFSPDAKLVAIGAGNKTGGDQDIRIWDVSSGKPYGSRLAGHKATVVDMAFSPDGKVLVSAGVDGALRLWDVETGVSLGGEIRPGINPQKVVFSPDGRTVFVAGTGELIFWIWDVSNFVDLSIEKIIFRACTIANRNLSDTEYLQYINPDPEAYHTYLQNPMCP